MKQEYEVPRIEKIEFDNVNVILTSVTPSSTGNGDVGRGRGRGGGCDAVPYHRNQRTFSSGRNSGCN